jgi:hypothetical protein
MKLLTRSPLLTLAALALFLIMAYSFLMGWLELVDAAQGLPGLSPTVIESAIQSFRL